ncbi:MAG: protein kinase [Myxococcota bacterium]
MSETLGPHPAKGDKLGRYTLDALIGAGGMASVYKAVDPHGDPYAVKVLNPARVLPEDVKRFQREYKALSRMDHENIVRVYESGIHVGYPWIAMELVDGQDLSGLIDQWKLDRPANRFVQIEHILRRLCSALQYVHDRKLIHRDIKPSNILITRSGEPKLSDFGVVKAGTDSSTQITQLTMAGRLVGTVAFMAPELITTDDAIDHRADLYSLGAMLYMMLCFRRPIEADSVAGYLARHLTEVPPSPGEIDTDVPRHLERVCNRLLLKDPAYRYPNASAVLQALDRDGDDEPPAVRGRDRQLQGWSRRMTALLEGAGGCVVVNGPTGSGKTHLMNAMVDVAKTTPAHCIAAVGWEYDPLDELARQAGLDPEGSLGTALSRAIITSLGRGPAVIAVDDLDRAPKRTIDSLTTLLRHRFSLEGEPLLLLCTATSLDAIAALVNGNATGIPADLVPVGPVDPRSAVAMMRDRGVSGAAATVLGRRLHTAYAGQPGAMVRQLESLVDSGWFRVLGPGALQLQVDMNLLRQGEMPVPDSVAAALRDMLATLTPEALELVQLLALLDRAAGASLLGRCTGDPLEAGRILDELARRGILVSETDETNERFAFGDPSTARVVRNGLDPELRRDLHSRIASTLSARRRRAVASEVAHHLAEAGQPAEAYPLFVAAARRAARNGTDVEVLDLCARAEALRAEAEATLPESESVGLKRQLLQLKGEAQLNRGDYEEARQSLKAALSAARTEDDTASVGRILGSLGRAWFRLDDFSRARPLLEESLQVLDRGAPERAHVTRALADIELRTGELARAEALWNQALLLAQDAGSRDGEARARRGLAHLKAFQGRLKEASRLLDEADDLLSLDGDPRVRAGVLARATELDMLSGNWGMAVRRAEMFVDLARRRELSERLPEAYALLAQILCGIGAWDEAYDAVAQAKVFSRAHPARFEPRLRAARVLLDLGRSEEAEEIMPAPEGVTATRVDDPAAQHAALRSRMLASTDPVGARDLAVWSLTRQQPLLGFRAAFIALDASKALSACEQHQTARTAAKRGLKLLKGLGGDGIRLEMLIALQTASPDARVLEALKQVALRIAARMPAPAVASFMGRPIIQDVLDGEPTMPGGMVPDPSEF